MHVYGLFCSLQWHGQEGHDGVRAGTEFQKVRNLPGDSFKARRKQALLKVKRNVKDPQRIIAPVDFNPHLPNVSQILKKHHKSMLIRAPHLKEVFKEAPMASFRQPPNLRRLLSKSKLHQLSKTE